MATIEDDDDDDDDDDDHSDSDTQWGLNNYLLLARF